MKYRRIEADYVALGIIAACLVCIGLNEAFNPAKVIARAVNNTVCEYQSRENASNYIFDANNISAYTDNSNTLDMGIEIAEGSYPFDNTLTLGAGTSANITLDRNVETKEAQLNADIKNKDASVLNVKAYQNNDEVTFSVPDLYEKNFITKVNDFSKQVYSLAGISFDADGTNENVVFDNKFVENLVNADMYKGNSTDMSDAIRYASQKALDKNGKEVSISSLGKEEYNGFNCKVYQIDVTPEGSKAVLKTFISTLLNDSAIKNTVYKQAEQEYNANAMMYQMYGVASAEDLAENAINQMQTQYEQIIDNSELNNTSIQVYINNGKLVQCQAGTSVSLMGTTVEVSGDAQFTGSKNITDIVSASYTMSSEGNTQRTLFSDTNAYDDTTLTSTKSSTSSFNGDTNTERFIVAYNSANNEFSFDNIAELNDVENSRLSVKGSVTKENNEVKFDIPTIETATSGTVSCKAKAHINVTALANDIKAIEGETVDLSNVENEEYTNIMTTFTNNLNNLRNKLK